jgi:ABC-type lipoprotein release transport system permease subunit
MKKDFIRLSIQNAKKHWRKSLITGLCITFGFTGIILLGGYMVRMERYLTTQGIYLNHVGHLTLYKKNGLERHLVEPNEYSINSSQQDKIIKEIQSRNEVEKVGRFIHGQGLMTNGCKSFPFLVWASEPEIQAYMRSYPLVQERIPLLTKLKKGRGFWEEGVSGVVITQRLAQRLDKFFVVGDQFEQADLRGEILENCDSLETKNLIMSHAGVQLLGNGFEGGLAAADSNIVGHYTTGFAFSEDGSMLMSLTDAQNFFSTDNVTSIGIFLKSADDTNNFEKWLESKEKEWNIDLDIYDYKDAEVNPFYVGGMRFVYIMNLFFFVIVCGVVVLALLNAIQIAILERKSEIGTYLAIGYRRSHVRNLFEIEAIVIAVLGLVLGLILSIILAAFVNSLGIPFDIVGNADKLYMELEVEWWYCLGLMTFFLGLVYIATSLICRRHLNVPVMRLLERAD